MITSLFFDYCLAATNPSTTIGKNDTSITQTLIPGTKLQLDSGAKICLILILFYMNRTETLPKNAFVIGDEESNQHAQVKYNMEWILCKGANYQKLEGSTIGPTKILQENISITLNNIKLISEESLKHFLYSTFGNYSTDMKKSNDVSQAQILMNTVYIRKCEDTKIEIQQMDGILALEADQPENIMLAMRFNKERGKMEYVTLDKETTEKVCKQANSENKQRFLFSRSQLENVLMNKGMEQRVIYFKTKDQRNIVTVKESNKNYTEDVIKRIFTIDHEYKVPDEVSDEEYFDCLTGFENMNLEETKDD